jgi:hypothetical protein
MMNASILQKITRISWATFLFTFPFSTSIVLYEQSSYRFGHFSPWVTGFFFLPEILLGLTVVLWLISRYPYHNLNSNFESRISSLSGSGLSVLGVVFLLNAFLVTFWQGDMSLFVFFLVRVVEAVCIVMLLTDQVLKPQEVVRVLLYGAGFQLLIAFFQWQTNHSLGLSFLGEPRLGPDILNVAKNNVTDTLKQIRPYGTFLHPNILAAYFLVILTLVIQSVKKGPRFLWIILLSAAVFLTGSLAAQLGLGLILLLLIGHSFLKNKKWLSLGFLALLFFGNACLFLSSGELQFRENSFSERVEQIRISKAMISQKPLGVGVWNFTLEMENFTDRKLAPWEFQPVHNTYFLIMNETGLQGLILLLLLGLLFIRNTVPLSFPLAKRGAQEGSPNQLRPNQLRPNQLRPNQLTSYNLLPLLTLLFIASFDHFFWDSWQGMVLVALVIGFIHLQSPDSISVRAGPHKYY